MKKVIATFMGVCLLLTVAGASLSAMEYNESPVLRVKVAAGELPPIEERIPAPDDVMVVVPLEEIGTYGGTWRLGQVGGFGTASTISQWETLLRWDRDGETTVPNVAKSYDFSADGKTLTFYLRKGVRWSDGAPLTADDIMFWYEDMVLNDELTPIKPGHLSPGGELVKVERLDDYTVRFNFAAPFGSALVYLASAPWGNVTYPKHYLKQFHPRYTPMEKLEEMAKEAGFEYWYQLFNNKNQWFWLSSTANNLERPVLRSYIATARKLDYLAFERNPYFFKVDPVGNQLPYIDKMVVTMISDKEVLSGKLLAGEIDYECIATPKLADYPLYKQGEEKGGYRVDLWGAGMGHCTFEPNQTYKEDLVLGDIFRDIRFRKALSYALNRDEINESLFYGRGQTQQASIAPWFKYWEEDVAKAYTEYDPEKANQLLDEMGLKWDKNKEYRLRPDGKRLSILVEHSVREGVVEGPVVEMAKEYWKVIGLDIAIKAETYQLLGERTQANLTQIAATGNAGTGSQVILQPTWWVLKSAGPDPSTAWGPLWALWYQTKGEEGEEPPEDVLQNLRDWEQIIMTIDEEEEIRLGKAILRRVIKENLRHIGTVSAVPSIVIANSKLGNVERVGYIEWYTGWAGKDYPETYFFKE